VSDASPEPQLAREKWNRRYTEKGLRPFPDRPAEWLVENRSYLIENRSSLVGSAGRRALDVACGDGRNALYLAQLGFDVVAVDVSDVAVTSLRAAAADRGLDESRPLGDSRKRRAARRGAIDENRPLGDSRKRRAARRGAIDARQVDLEHEPLPAERFDVIVQLNYLQRDLFGPLARALTVGGILLVETVTRAHVEELGNDFDPRFVLDYNELLQSFPDLHILHYREGLADRSGRPRAVASLVAERRAPSAEPREPRAERRG